MTTEVRTRSVCDRCLAKHDDREGAHAGEVPVGWSVFRLSTRAEGELSWAHDDVLRLELCPECTRQVKHVAQEWT